MKERIRESVLDIAFKKAGKSRFNNVNEMTNRRELDDLVAKMQQFYDVVVNIEADGSGYVKNISVEDRTMDPLSFAEWARAEWDRMSNRASYRGI